MNQQSHNIMVLLSSLLLISYFFIIQSAKNYEVKKCMQYAYEQLVAPGNKVGGVLFVPDHNVKEALIGLINYERKFIKAALYHLTDPDIYTALIDAKKRGIIVEIITDKSCVASKYEKISQLKKQGIKVYVYGKKKQYSIMHNKFWIFGKNLCSKPLLWTGSANATISGTTRNEENVVVDDRKPIIKLYVTKFEQLKNKIKATKIAPKKSSSHFFTHYFRLRTIQMFLNPKTAFKIITETDFFLNNYE